MLEQKKYVNKEKWMDLFYVISSISMIFIIIWSLTGMWPWSANPYNSYALQANSWLHGRLDLGQNYEYLELAIFNQNYYVSFPPFPSFVLLPFALVFGNNTPDGLLALVSVVLGAIYALKLLWAFGKKGSSAVFWVLFLTVGSNLLYVTVNGWVWFLAQNICFTLSIMAIYYAIHGKGGWSLFYWACSVGCRPFQIIYLPILIWIIYRRIKNDNADAKILDFVKRYWYWMISPLIVACIYMLLNYARFGNVAEFGHNYLPEFSNAEKGQFDIEYFMSNINKLFLLPTIDLNNRVVIPKFDGMALWIASPIFISYFLYWICHINDLLKKRKNVFWLPFTILLLFLVHTVLILSHRTLGGIHYGNRYFVDLLPFLFYSILLFKPDPNKFEKMQYPLLVFGIASNLIGTIIIYNNWI